MRVSMSRQQQVKASRQISVVLIGMLLLMQSVLAFLITPVAVTSDSPDGEMVIVLCTLKGAQDISIAMPDLLGDDQNTCPALALDHVASGITLVAAPPVLSLPPRAVERRAIAITAFKQTTPFGAFKTRAPPLA